MFLFLNFGHEDHVQEGKSQRSMVGNTKTTERRVHFIIEPCSWIRSFSANMQRSLLKLRDPPSCFLSRTLHIRSVVPNVHIEILLQQ